MMHIDSKLDLKSLIQYL